MENTDISNILGDELDEPIEEHIEMESATGRFKRDAIKAAQGRAEAEALANNRRDMRIPADSFIARYMPGEEAKKFSLLSKTKKCTVIDASIRGLGIEAHKGFNKGDKVTLTISDGKKGVVPEFDILATVMYVGAKVDKKTVRYGLQYDQTPTESYSEFINSETLKRKMEKNTQKKEAAEIPLTEKHQQKPERKVTEQSPRAVQATIDQVTDADRAIRQERIAKILQKRKAS